MLTIVLWLAVSLVLLAFFCEYIDSTLGMGYGTTLTPVLLILGFSPMQIVPVVLLSELITGVLASFFHHREGNVDLKPKTMDIRKIARSLQNLGYVESFRRGIPRHLKVAMVLAGCSVFGTVAAVFVAISIPKFWLKMYIGGLVLAMGIIMLILRRRRFSFSWAKITGLGMLASFNKGMSGGGYGPIVTGGQVLSGVDSKSAVGITSLAEGLTCLVGVIAYIFVARAAIDWVLAPYIILGAVLSVPLSAKSVRFVSEANLKYSIAIATIVLGLYTVIQTLGGR